MESLQYGYRQRYRLDAASIASLKQRFNRGSTYDSAYHDLETEGSAPQALNVLSSVVSFVKGKRGYGINITNTTAEVDRCSEMEVHRRSSNFATIVLISSLLSQLDGLESDLLNLLENILATRGLRDDEILHGDVRHVIRKYEQLAKPLPNPSGPSVIMGDKMTTIASKLLLLQAHAFQKPT